VLGRFSYAKRHPKTFTNCEVRGRTRDDRFTSTLDIPSHKTDVRFGISIAQSRHSAVGQVRSLGRDW
jgi:hypothetical protein